MGHFLHRVECRSWIYPWRCPDCSHPIFVYQCTCGSGVFFEHNAPPWPHHDCARAQHAAFMKGPGAWLKEGMKASAAVGQPLEGLKGFVAKGQGAPSQEPDGLQPPGPPPAARFDTIVMNPIAGDAQSFIGVVRAISTKTAKLAQLYDGLGDVGKKLLGLPAKSRAVQLTIERNDDDPVESFTGIAVRDDTVGVHVGQMVWVTFEARDAPGKLFWLVRSLQPL